MLTKHAVKSFKYKKEGVVFRIDFENAYDHVDWGFLDHALKRK